MKTGQKKPKIMIFQGSPRNKEDCPDQNSKTSKLTNKVIKDLSTEIDFDLCDLSIQPNKPLIQPCKSCIGTAGGFHCHFSCDCYTKNDKERPDFMHDYNVYSRLEECDGFAVFTPTNWYGPSTSVKAMFDRLVCINLTLTQNQAKKLLGENDIKNSKKTRALSKSKKYDHLLKNHLEGKYAAFLIHGDYGANDYTGREKPSSLNEKDEKVIGSNYKLAIMPIVMQCRYSGIHVPDDLIEHFYYAPDIDYATSNDMFENHIDQEGEMTKRTKALMLKLKNYLIN